MKSIRQSLAVFGCIAAFTGILTIVIFGAPAFSTDTVHALAATESAAVYIGSGGCLTCHADNEGNWTNVPQRSVQFHAINNPYAVSIAIDEEAPTTPPEIAPEIAPENLSRPHQADRDERETDSQKYMILTDAGYFLLPDDWTVADHPAVEGENTALSPDKCGDCHRFRRTTVSDEAFISLARFDG